MRLLSENNSLTYTFPGVVDIMDLNRHFTNLDEYLLKAHEKVVDKINDLVGWSNFQIAKVVNSGRWALLLPLAAYIHIFGGENSDRWVIIRDVLLLGVVATGYIFSRISSKEKEAASENKQNYETLPVNYLDKGVDRGERLTHLLIPLPLLTGAAFYNAQGKEIVFLVLGLWGVNFAINSSALYFAANYKDPTKGKLVKVLESAVEATASLFKRPNPQPVPQRVRIR